MAAPSYAQSVLDTRMNLPYCFQRPDSNADASSVADISTVVHSDTEDSEGPNAPSLDRTRRSFLNSVKSKLLVKSGRFTGSQAVPSARPDLSRSSTITTQQHSAEHIHDNMSDSDVAGSGTSKAGSIYSLSRVSFTSRLAQLTSIPLPTASSLQARISSQSTAHLAARTLSEASDQIRLWTKKASDVLQDLDAQDDVEWSAAGGSDGLEEVNQAIARFEGLVKVYVISIEELQTRSDVKTLSDETLKGHVEQMEDVITDWQQIKQSLRMVKDQVEIALEWEELWNSVLGGVAQELGSLTELIFEMEEKRHQAVAVVKGQDYCDLDELADVVEHGSSPTVTPVKSQRASTSSFPTASPTDLATASSRKDDSKLLALFARMQTLRASLDFLPMRLSVFHARSNALFPTGCTELENRQTQLEGQWKKLETDAEALKKELGEDKWLTVFRNAGRQALKMFESVERSVLKLNQSVASGLFQSDPHAFARIAESLEAKKTHYVPAIDRVLGLIDRGVADRRSVNGEILRLQSELKQRYKWLQSDIKILDELMVMPDAHGQQLRESISTILSSERSAASSVLDSPHSSPASSIMIRSRNSSVNGQSTQTAKTLACSKTRLSSSLAPATPSVRSRSRLSDTYRSVTSPGRVNEPYIDKKADVFRDFKEPSNKPRWNSGTTNTPTRDFLPLSATEPSPYRIIASTTATPRKYTPSRVSQIPSLSRAGSPTPDTPSSSSRRVSSARLPPRSQSALEHRSASGPVKRRVSGGRLQPPSSSSTPLVTGRKYSTTSTLATVQDDEEASTPTAAPSSLPRPASRLHVSRPPSALSTATNFTGGTRGSATGRRSSLANPATASTTPGRRTSGLLAPQWSAGRRDSRVGQRAASAMSNNTSAGFDEDEKPRWRF